MENNQYSRRSKEIKNIDVFYSNLLMKFHKAMFTIDFDDPKTPNVNVFDMFNRAWVAYANDFNKKAKRVGADPDKFFNYAINHYTDNAIPYQIEEITLL